VLNQLKREPDRAVNQVERLDRAIGALAGLGSRNSPRRGRRRISAAARRRIPAAQRTRWADGGGSGRRVDFRIESGFGAPQFSWCTQRKPGSKVRTTNL